MNLNGDSAKNDADALFFTRELVHVSCIVSERKQTAFIADKKLHSQVSRRFFATGRSEKRLICHILS